jgi:hypothetical protein
VKFLMDGTEHETGSGCLCGGDATCHTCHSTKGHYQGVYGGFVEWCEVCDAEAIKRNEVKEADPPKAYKELLRQAFNEARERTFSRPLFEDFDAWYESRIGIKGE